MKEEKHQKMNKPNHRKFLEFYDVLGPKIYRHALFRTSSKQSAEDITSEAFLRTWQYLIETKKPIKNFRAFIYRITNNLIVDHYRRQPKEPIFLEYDEFKTMPGPETRPGIIHEEDMKKIFRALNKLSSEQKNILIWRYIDGLGIKEITKITGKSCTNIYVIIHRALKNLKNHI